MKKVYSKNGSNLTWVCVDYAGIPELISEGRELLSSSKIGYIKEVVYECENPVDVLEDVVITDVLLHVYSYVAGYGAGLELRVKTKDKGESSIHRFDINQESYDFKWDHETGKVIPV